MSPTKPKHKFHNHKGATAFRDAVSKMKVGEKFNPASLAPNFGLHKTTTYRIASEMQQRGVLGRVDRGTYVRLNKQASSSDDVGSLLDTIINAVGKLEAIAAVSLKNIPTADLLAELGRRHASTS